MKRNTSASMGAIHPIIFFTLVYAISLFFAIFICRTVYNSLHAPSAQNFSSSPATGLQQGVTAYK